MQWHRLRNVLVQRLLATATCGPTNIQSGNLAIWPGKAKRKTARGAICVSPASCGAGGWPIAREDPVSHVYLPLPGAPLLPPSFPSPRPTATRWPSGGRPPPSLAPWQQKDTQADRTLASYTEQTGRSSTGKKTRTKTSQHLVCIDSEFRTPRSSRYK